MMKNFFTLLVLMLGCMGTAMAQRFQVVTNPTEMNDLKSGYYVIKVKSADNKTDENGNFLYIQNSKAYYETKGSATNLVGSSFSDEGHKYVFYVDKSNGQLTFQAYGTEVYFPSISKASLVPAIYNPGRQNQITLNSSYSRFTPVESAKSWYYMKTAGTKYSWGVKDVTIYVILNENQQVGYYDTSDNANNNAQFQFYKAVGAANITYDLRWNGESKSKQTLSAAVGDPFPIPTLPDYTTSSDLPSADAIVSDADNGRELVINCTAELPFTLSTAEAPVYYYLTTDTDAPTMLYRNGNSMKYRVKEQNATLNDVKNDLWYVTGNPFDGYKFYNAANNKEAQSSDYIMKNGTAFAGSCYLSLTSVSAGAIAGGSSISGGVTKVWDLHRDGDHSFGIYPHGASMDYCWRFDGSEIKFNTASDRITSYTLVEPTITLPLHYSEADDATFATTCLPYAVELADASQNAKVYAAKMDADGVHLQMNEVTAIPAGQGVILRGEGSDATEINLKVVNDVPAIDNDLLGTTSEISDISNILAFGRLNHADGSKGNVGFSRLTGSKLSANRAYIQSIMSQSLALDFNGQTTGINVFHHPVSADASVYDIQGRRIKQPVSGQFYIQGGRKFIAR